MEPTRKAGPVDSADRLLLMDALRGMALFGIFVVNMGMMVSPSMAYGSFSLWADPVSTGVSVLRDFFADGAFFFLFSLLFGAGFAIMMGPFGRREEGIGLPAYYRRLLLVGFLGFLHVSLFWWGDILMIYAVAGAFLPFFRKRKDRSVLIWTAILICAPIFLFSAFLYPDFVESSGSDGLMASYDAFTREWIAYLVEAYRVSDFWAVARTRWDEYLSNSWVIWVSISDALGYMLLGLWFTRRNRFHMRPDSNDRFFRRLFPWMVLAALVGKTSYVAGLYGGYSSIESLLFLVGSGLCGPAFGLVYLCGLRWLFRRGAVVWLQQGLAAAGRMALTNYLAQSAFVSWLAYGYGLGLYGEVSPLLQVLIVLGFFALQMQVSSVWFGRFRMGPLEWGLRSFTYWRMERI